MECWEPNARIHSMHFRNKLAEKKKGHARALSKMDAGMQMQIASHNGSEAVKWPGAGPPWASTRAPPRGQTTWQGQSGAGLAECYE